MVFAQTWWARYAIWNCSITYRTKHTMDRWTVLMRLSPEKKIFSSKLEPLFGDCECVIVDVGYSGTKCILHKRILGRQWRVNIPKVSRAWEETVNERLKKFYILKNVYRNPHRHAPKCFLCRAKYYCTFVLKWGVWTF